jgi:formylglycine-generating enzyme required for sulfatase activity
MDKQDKINDLFRTAREQEPKTSFDETKERFLKSLEQLPSDQSPKNVSFFNFKKWRIMLSSIIIIASITVALFNTGNVKTENKMKSTSKMEVKEKEILTQIKTNNSLLNSSEILLNNSEKTFNLSQTILKENKSINEMIVFGPVRNKYQQIPFDDTLKKDVLLFPKLTPKEIDCNNKQKKEILKVFAKPSAKLTMFSYIPSGSFNYNDKEVSIHGFFIQKTEVSNLEYRTFLYDLLIQDRREDFLKASPNQKKWSELKGGENKKMEMYYFSHRAYNNFPVCNVSREGAEMYCTWLIQELEKSKYADAKSKLYNVRIPSRVEWVYAASNLGENKTYPWSPDGVKNSFGTFYANCNESRQNIQDDVLKSAISNIPSELGLYCISGNIAEMVYNSPNSRLEPGTAGGGWMDSADEIKILAEDKYKGIIEAHPNIGFRIVMTHIGRNTKKLLIK